VAHDAGSARDVQEAGAIIYELLDVLQNFSCDGAVT
jgi:hypothetical protein